MSVIGLPAALRRRVNVSNRPPCGPERGGLMSVIAPPWVLRGEG